MKKCKRKSDTEFRNWQRNQYIKLNLKVTGKDFQNKQVKQTCVISTDLGAVRGAR